MTKLLILSSNTGEGHNSAAAAIESAAKTAGIVASVRRPLEESGRLNRALGSFYNLLLTKKPEWMNGYLWLIDRVRPNDRAFIYRHFRGFMHDFLNSEKPDIVLSVHPMLNHFIPRFIKEERLGVPCYTFLTDPFPPFWRGWASPYVDRYFVVRDEAAKALRNMGIAEQNIEHVSMPVRRDFVPASSEDIARLKNELQFDTPGFILINGGARGGGPVFETYETVRKAGPDANILVISGRNKALQRRIEELRDPRTRVFGFVADIHRYIGAADLVLTKPGAMSTYEALACNVPVVLLGICALMPQESGMFQAAAQYGFGFAAGTFETLAEIIARGPEEWARTREALAQFYRSNSGNQLIERIQPVHAGA